MDRAFYKIFFSGMILLNIHPCYKIYFLIWTGYHNYGANIRAKVESDFSDDIIDPFIAKKIVIILVSCSLLR